MMDFQARALKKEEEKDAATFETMSTTELGKVIEKAFLLYDKIGNRTIDVRHAGDVVRGLGCVPSEAELRELEAAIAPTDGKREIGLKRFLPPVFNMICEGRMQPASKEEILTALRALDKERRGHLRPDWLTEVLLKEGEQFTRDEAAQMMRLAVDPDSGRVDYEYYVNQLEVHVEPDVYSLVPPPEETRRSSRVSVRLSLKAITKAPGP